MTFRPLVTLLLFSLAAGAEQEQPPAIRVDVDVVSLLCSVRDKADGREPYR
jgi:hypothetical protein